jgi:hypothetical protein
LARYRFDAKLRGAGDAGRHGDWPPAAPNPQDSAARRPPGEADLTPRGAGSPGDGNGQARTAAGALQAGRPSGFSVLRRQIVLVLLHLKPEAVEASPAASEAIATNDDELEALGDQHLQDGR